MFDSQSLLRFHLRELYFLANVYLITLKGPNHGKKILGKFSKISD